VRRKKTWYFVDPGSKARDLFNMLHLPYTSMVLGFVVAGASAAPSIRLDVLAGALAAYFLGLGVGAHAVDQLEPHGSHYVGSLSRRELKALALVGLGGGVAIGLCFAASGDALLLPFIVLGAFFAVAYPLPSRVAWGIFHNDWSFAISWGSLPLVTAYFAEARTIGATAVVGGGVAGLVALAEIRLSRKSRAARKEGRPESEYTGRERRLMALASATCMVSVMLLAVRLF
jgi:hypothetical protein